jgi:endonuclease/exonuclease/phosphatase family metal-dependent hydrolase
MTTEQIKALRDKYLPGNFAQYRTELREEARRLGHKVDANDIIKVLEANANDDNRVITDAAEGRTPWETGPGTPEPDDAKPDAKPQPLPDGKAKGEDIPVPSTPSDDAEAKAEAKRQKMADDLFESLFDDEDAEAKAKQEALKKQMAEAEEAERAASKKQEEAEKLRKELDELRKRQEAKRKQMEEEERKRREEEELKNLRHYKTDDLIETLKATGLAYLVGPAGTGKSTLAMDACAELFGVPKDDFKFNEHFAQISFSPDTTSGEMVGRCDINGVFHRSEVVRVFSEGGLILFDEIDNADASMLVKLNTAIANGTFATPEGLVRKNKNTVIVCTANTYGTGPDAMYVGRTRLAAATLDRFVCSTIEVDYDVKLEGTRRFPQGNSLFLKRCRLLETKEREYPKRKRAKYYKFARVEMDGREVCVIETHLDFDTGPDDPLREARADQMRTIIADMANEKHVIICGDFNISSRPEDAKDHAAEYDVFAKAGYAMANHGQLMTWPSYRNPKREQPLDNIIVKGFEISDVEVKSSERLSDHKMLSCNLRFLEDDAARVRRGTHE